MRHQFPVKKGQKIVELSEGKSLSLSWELKADVIITICPARDEDFVRRSQQRLARMWASDMAKSGKGKLNLSDLCYGWFKGRFLSPYIADHDATLADRFQAIKVLMARPDPVHFAVVCDSVLSTSLFSCAEVSEALRNWQDFMNEHDINYRDPADQKAALQIEWNKTGGNL